MQDFCSPLKNVRKSVNSAPATGRIRLNIPAIYRFEIHFRPGKANLFLVNFTNFRPFDQGGCLADQVDGSALR
jgi:hypothetical protein